MTLPRTLLLALCCSGMLACASSEVNQRARTLPTEGPQEHANILNLPSRPLLEPINKNFTVVRTLFATTRNQTRETAPAKMFGNDPAAMMTYGKAYVTIPRDHKLGELESPSIWRLELTEDPLKHVVLAAVHLNDKSSFYRVVRFLTKDHGPDDLLLFVHGFDVSFEDAARRTAQLAYDLHFSGVPMFFSWPSQDNPAAYPAAERNAEWTRPYLEEVLTEMLASVGVQNVYLLGHSMGNRVLTKALVNLYKKNPSFSERVTELILTAPDIDANIFKRDIAPVLAQSNKGITLYASETDSAIKISNQFHGYPRAGDAGEHLVITPGVETVDATGVDTSFFGHSYYAENRLILSDIYYLLKGKRARERFGLTGVDTPTGLYWRFIQH